MWQLRRWGDNMTGVMTLCSLVYGYPTFHFSLHPRNHTASDPRRSLTCLREISQGGQKFIDRVS